MGNPPSGKPPETGPGGPPPESDHAALPDEELLAECRVDTFRSGGKGGQHQNKTESGVRLTHEPTGIVVTARDSRSQSRNRSTALERLRAELEARAHEPPPRVPTRVPLKEKHKRVDEKKRKARVKRLRRKPKLDD